MARILMDCDGVLADFIGLVSKILGRPVVPDQWAFIKELPEIEQRTLKVALSVSSYWRNMDAMAGAVTGYLAIEDAGNEIIVVTAPWVGCPEWYYQRRRWLERRFGANGKRLIATSRKDVIDGDVLVDDRPDNIIDWLVTHPYGEACLYLHSYNFKHPIRQDSRVTSFTWDRVPDVLLRG